MTKLKLSSIQDDKPVKVSVVLPAALHRDLVAYAEILRRESGQAVEPTRLIVAMLEKFMASDRGFGKARGSERKPTLNSSTPVGAPPTSSAPD
ncbi:MAG: DUF2274 domain-containing protein [Methylocystaceae bacterium]|nr:MAG: DUF2274 domain-containing protein [Methylocystaceae bacterium]